MKRWSSGAAPWQVGPHSSGRDTIPRRDDETIVSGVRRALAALVVSSAAAGCSTDSAGSTPTFNVLLVVVDSARVDAPKLEIADAVVFERAYAPSAYTSQSVAALLTGRLPTSGGSIGLLEAEPSERARTVPQRFRRAGYRTGLVSSQGLLARRGFTRGFEDIQVASLTEDWSAREVAERALDFVESVGDESWFLYAHFVEPHQPYDPPAEFLQPDHTMETVGDVSVVSLQEVIERDGPLAATDPRLELLIARYRAEVAAVDAAVQSLLDALGTRGLLDNTVVVFTGSQGEELGEHGWLGHAWTLYEEVLRVPLRMRVPGLAESQVATPVSIVDLAPTLLRLADIPYEDSAMDGNSLLAVTGAEVRVQALARPKIAELVIRERCIHRAVIDGDWKYIRTIVDCPLGERRGLAAAYTERLAAMAAGDLEVPDLWGAPVGEELYHLGLDPGETQNLADTEPEALSRLRRMLDNYAAHCRKNGLDAASAVVPAEFADPATTERLQSLGYL